MATELTDSAIRGLFTHTLDDQNRECSMTGRPTSEHEAVLFEVDEDRRWAVHVDSVQVDGLDPLPNGVQYWIGADYFGTEPDLNDDVDWEVYEDPFLEDGYDPYTGSYGED